MSRAVPFLSVSPMLNNTYPPEEEILLEIKNRPELEELVC
jgi:hypothetical protein